ncbi:MAG TPA: tripartite tricarboxylate transporter substrate-binding protein [Burkholderiaceae bacterium]
MLVNAGTTVDGAARLTSEQFRKSLGRDTVVFPRLGAGGRLALAELRRAAPDGRNVIFSPSSPLTIYPNIYKRLDYNPDADFTPISGVALFDVAIACGVQSDIKTLPELIEWARKQPTGLTFGCAPGNGSSSHFLGIATALATKLTSSMVPYKDTTAGLSDLISGRVPVFITGTGAMSEMHKAGKLRVLATSGSRRSTLVANIPTFQESGINVTIENATILLGPARLPKEAVDRMHAAVLELWKDPDARAKMALMGMDAWPVDAGHLAQWLIQERQRYAALAKGAGYVPEDA